MAHFCSSKKSHAAGQWFSQPRQRLSQVRKVQQVKDLTQKPYIARTSSPDGGGSMFDEKYLHPIPSLLIDKN